MTQSTTESLSDLLDRLDACSEAREWAQSFGTLAEAWAVCPRGDWMLWLIGRTIAREPESAARKRLVLCACACARTALPYVPEGDARPRRAIETAEAWAREEVGITLSDVRAAASAAAAAYAAAAASAAAAAYAAAAAASAAAAAYAAAYAAAECADLVRQHYPLPPVMEEQP